MRYLMNRRGASVVIYCISLSVLLAAASLVADIGLMIAEKNKVTNAVDAAVLAGTQELIYNTEHSISKAQEYLERNGVNPSNARIDLLEEGNGLRVYAEKKVDFFLARALGFDGKTVAATSSAMVLPVTAVSGVRPFAIEDQELLFGETYVLKSGGGGGYNGNYGGLELGGAGAHTFYNNIVNGYSDRLFVGDYIFTEPGNMSGPTENGIETLVFACDHYPRCTAESFAPDCPRAISVVIVDTLNVNGRSQVQVVGFASFFLEGVAGSGNESIVTGKFIRSITTGEISESQKDYGLYGVKLME